MSNDNPVESATAPIAAAGTPTSSGVATDSAARLHVGLLDNVQLDATLRFGQRQLTLRELGALRFGSVVELDKTVQEPAELLVGDKVVARGEVVVVDGNYGLRVTDVVASQS